MSNGLDKRTIPVCQLMTDGSYRPIGEVTVRRSGQLSGQLLDCKSFVELLLNEVGVSAELNFDILPFGEPPVNPENTTVTHVYDEGTQTFKTRLTQDRDKNHEYRIDLFARAKEIVDRTVDITEIRAIDMQNVVFSPHEQYLDLIIKVAEWLMGEDFE